MGVTIDFIRPLQGGGGELGSVGRIQYDPSWILPCWARERAGGGAQARGRIWLESGNRGGRRFAKVFLPFHVGVFKYIPA